MIKTKLTDLLGVEYPIIQGGMAWVAEAKLAAAVSNAGGVGLIAGGTAPVDYIKEQIEMAKSLTDKPFGLNIMMMSPNAADLAQLAIDEKIAVITTGAGNPGKYIEAWKNAGIKVIPVIPSVGLAKRMERAGADAIIAEGTEAGGHIGEISTMCIVPQVVDAVDIPVLAAGGIADGRGLAAVFMLGASGVQIGTRFLVAEECQVHENYTQMVLGAKDTDSAVTGRFTGHPVRSIRNRLTKKLINFERDGGTPEEFEQISVGSLRKAAVEGDLKEGSFMAGQVSGLVHKIEPAKDIVESMFSEAEEIMKNGGGVIIE